MKVESKKPLYTKIADDIRNKILNGVIISGDKLSGEFELAGQYNVSRITSKRALDVLESEGMIYRIKGSGSYVSKDAVSNKKTNNIKIIAMIMPFSQKMGNGVDILHGVESIAKDRGYYVSYHTTDGDYSNEKKIILDLLNNGVEGIVYYPIATSENFGLLKMLTMKQYPIVMIDKYINDIPIDSVVTDNFKGSYQMTEYLLKNGHENISFATTSPIHECSSIKERFLGYCSALENHNIPLDVDKIWCCENTVNNGLDYNKVLENFLKSCYSSGVTAIQVVSDMLALEFVKVANTIGIRIPQDISIVGFDDLDISTMVTPQLTTVKQNFIKMGTEAARLVIEKIINHQKLSKQIKLSTELVIRDSVLSI